MNKINNRQEMIELIRSWYGDDFHQKYARAFPNNPVDQPLFGTGVEGHRLAFGEVGVSYPDYPGGDLKFFDIARPNRNIY